VTTPDIVILDDEDALARESADRFVGRAREAISARGSFTVALAGGSTPKAAYALLAGDAYRGRVDWSRVRFFFGDERCVPPDDAQSNFRMAYDAMLGPLGIPENRIFRMRGEDDAAAAARAYDDVLARELGPQAVLDLIQLGMGPEGHTASIFPGSQALTAPGLVAAVYVEKVAMYRITLTPRALNAARDVTIATSGAAKAAVLARVLEGPRDPNVTPIQAIRPSSGTLTWLIDRAAAADLTSVSSTP
jgi:6-phosphogluconolactonase